ncbi:MAG: hypothetical protein COA84_13915 [Robiginitomaculum sp.]|nr:MAG: hypothetical protein COA84_13915 [Robiginitomaculum sp.]
MPKVLIKTPCASAVLAYFGVSGTTWNDRTLKNVWANTLRRNGFNVRSRFSHFAGNEKTVGSSRDKITKIADADIRIKAFVVTVFGHVLVLDRNGDTVVDTDPRKIDRRAIFAVQAVM